MLDWKDVSRYSQTDKERKPKSWKATINDLEVLVHRHIYYDGWVLTVRELNIDKKQLSGEDIEDCKKQALDFVRKEVEARLMSFMQIKNAIDRELSE